MDGSNLFVLGNINTEGGAITGSDGNGGDMDHGGQDTGDGGSGQDNGGPTPPDDHGEAAGAVLPAPVLPSQKPELIFSAVFPEQETWRDLRLSDYPWLQTIVPDTLILM